MPNEIKNWKLNIALFLSGQCVSLFGSMVVHYAVLWHITLTARSGVAMMLFTISVTIPMFLVSPIAGVWADRYSKKMLICIADAAIAAVTLFMAVLFSLGFEYMALLLVCIAARGLGQGIQTPAVGSFLPEIVPEESLIRVNGISGSMQSAIMFCSPVAGGALIAFMPIQTALYLDVLTASIGISLLLFFVKSFPKEKKPEQKARRELIDGFKYIKGHAFIKKLMILSVLYNLLITPAAVLTPLQVVRNFGPDEWRLVAIELAFFVGMALGGLFIAAWGGFKNKSHTMALAIALTGIFVIGLGITGSFIIYMACIGFSGFSVAVFNAPMMTVIQTKIEAEFLGRVFSVLTMLASITMPTGMVVWGPLADIVLIDWLMISSGLGILLTGVFFVMSKTLMEAGINRQG